MNKKVVSLLALFVLVAFYWFVVILPSIAEASPGGLDKNGGHRCRKSKSYCAKYGLRLNQYHCHRRYCKLK